MNYFKAAILKSPIMVVVPAHEAIELARLTAGRRHPTEKDDPDPVVADSDPLVASSVPRLPA